MEDNLNFDGTSDYMEVPDIENWNVTGWGLENFTISFWIRGK